MYICDFSLPPSLSETYFRLLPEESFKTQVSSSNILDANGLLVLYYLKKNCPVLDSSGKPTPIGFQKLSKADSGKYLNGRLPWNT